MRTYRQSGEERLTAFVFAADITEGFPLMKHNQIRQVVFPILAALIWGTAFVAQDVCADTIGTFTFNAVRYFIAVLALLVLIAVLNATRKDRPQPTEAEKRAGRKQLWLGGFCCGTALAVALRFVCHFISGAIIFANFDEFVAFGASWVGHPWLYSFCYNGTYMLPELIFTVIAAVILFRLPQMKKLIADEGE